MGTIKQIGISDFLVIDSPVKLRTIGIGSCIGLVLYDKCNKIGGMAHIMLPNSPEDKKNIDYKKYCDTSIPLVYEKMLQLGAVKHELRAGVFGGAQMFAYLNSPLLNIGKRNIESTLSILNDYKVPVIFQDTGGSKGRTVEFDIETGKIFLRTAYEDEVIFVF